MVLMGIMMMYGLDLDRFPGCNKLLQMNGQAYMLSCPSKSTV